jgi:hypothetical protein
MILMPRLPTLLLAAATLLPAQQLVNNGKPMRISAECKQDDLQYLGLSCSEDEPCPAYLELNAVEAVGSRIFLAGNIHTSTVTLSSILLASADDGKTWMEPYDRVRFAALEQIQFIDFQNGWISAAIIQTLPRDPFFLLTSDGGKTWRNRPLFDEPHGGSIEHFWFDSRNTGALLLTPIGRSYEMYESMTAGESWSLKQVSTKPLALPHTRALGASGWRLRPNSRSHSYDVEIKEASGWQRVASFLVDAGVCK